MPPAGDSPPIPLLPGGLVTQAQTGGSLCLEALRGLREFAGDNGTILRTLSVSYPHNSLGLRHLYLPHPAYLSWDLNSAASFRLTTYSASASRSFWAMRATCFWSSIRSSSRERY